MVIILNSKILLCQQEIVLTILDVFTTNIIIIITIL